MKGVRPPPQYFLSLAPPPPVASVDGPCLQSSGLLWHFAAKKTSHQELLQDLRTCNSPKNFSEIGLAVGASSFAWVRPMVIHYEGEGIRLL